MNGNAACYLEVPNAYTNESRKQSECEAAYDALRASQEMLAQELAALHERLGPVLNQDSGGERGEAPSSSHQSEIHGWLIAADERTCALIRRVRAIAGSLTI